MKIIIEEYGKLVICVFLGLLMLSYLFSYSDNGFMTSIKKYQPKSAIKLEDNAATLKEYGKVLTPRLEVETPKLIQNRSYDLLSAQFIKSMKRRTLKKASDDPSVEENITETDMIDAYTLRIKKICDKTGTELALPPDGRTYQFTSQNRSDEEPTIYQVTYELTDTTYPDYPVATTVTCRFLVD